LSRFVSDAGIVTDIFSRREVRGSRREEMPSAVLSGARDDTAELVTDPGPEAKFDPDPGFETEPRTDPSPKLPDSGPDPDPAPAPIFSLIAFSFAQCASHLRAP